MKGQGEYKYILQRSSRKMICPECGRRTFVPFVLNNGTNGDIVNGEKYGRCDREKKCGYFLYPKSENAANMADIVPIRKPERPTDYIPYEFVERTMRLFPMQTLFVYFSKCFGGKRLTEAWERYKCGTAKNGATIWWQIDCDGNVRTGKIMQYLPNGHRNKAERQFGSWVHCDKRKFKKDYNLKQCLFGEHLITDGCKVAICESEKTAVCMSMILPQYVWLATGGLQNTQTWKFKRLLELHCAITFFPDKGCLHDWQNKLGNIGSYDFTMENDKVMPDGSDIWDYYEYFGLF